MAARLWKTCNNLNLSPKISYNLSNQVRHGHHLRGKPPGVARSLEQRLEGSFCQYLTSQYNTVMFFFQK